eukprot:jgi/Picsp_1/4444/NSC_06666-R1_family protein
MVGIARASAFATRGQFARRVVPYRGRKSGIDCSASLMTRYQYARKAHAMAKEGYKVRDFGHRAIGEGCSGPDVLSLQEWLAESGYYNPSDGGFNGYFGSVTKEALQMWQRDVGVQVSGCFDSASKMAYLEHVRRSHGSNNGSNDGEIVLCEELVLSKTYPFRKTSVAQLFKGVLPENQEWRVGAEMAYVAIGMLGLVSLIALSKANMIFVPFDRVKRAIGGFFLVLGSQGRIQNSKPAQMTREQDEPIENDTLPENNIKRPRKSNNSTPRLSREELEKFLAPMKGVQQSKRRRATGPAPYRDDGRITSVYVNKKDNTKMPDVQQGIVTPHGVYFASPRKDVMAPTKQPGPTGLQSSRMESIGYNMNGSMDEGTRRHPLLQNKLQNKRSQGEPVATYGSKSTAGQMSQGARSAQYPIQPITKQDGSLLDGTELDPTIKFDRQTRTENVPSKPKSPVPVVRPGENDGVAMMGKGKEGQGTSESIQNTSRHTTVILHDKPVKLHKPSRLVKDE